MTTETKSESLIGKVTALNKDGTGCRIGNEWMSYTKPEWRDEVWDEPEVGDQVKVLYNVSATGKKFIQSIEVVEGKNPFKEEGGATVAQGDGYDAGVNKRHAMRLAVETVIARYSLEPPPTITKPPRLVKDDIDDILDIYKALYGALAAD